MGKKYDLLSFGEILLRLSSEENERLDVSSTFRKNIGGAECNVAAAVSALGLRAGIISKVPGHALGRYAKRTLSFSGVDTTFVKEDLETDARLGLYYYETGANPRKPRVVYDRRGSSVYKLSPDEFPEEMYSSATCFHTSGITLALSPKCRETAVEMIRRFKENGTLISFDVNYRGNLWNGEEAKACIEKILPYVDIFFCSESTARLTFHKEGDIKQIMKEFAQTYPLSVVASTRRMVHSPRRHDFDSVLYGVKENCFYEEEAYKNIEVVDRIGSGDAYVAGVLHGLLSENGNCDRALKTGNALGALKNTISGDLCFTGLQEIEEIIKEHGVGKNVIEMTR